MEPLGIREPPGITIRHPVGTQDDSGIRFYGPGVLTATFLPMIPQRETAPHVGHLGEGGRLAARPAGEVRGGFQAPRKRQIIPGWRKRLGERICDMWTIVNGMNECVEQWSKQWLQNNTSSVKYV